MSIRIGSVAATSQLAADFEAVHLRQHQIQHHQVRIVAVELDERLLAVARGHDRIALLLEVQAQQFHDVALVVHDEDRLHGSQHT